MGWKNREFTANLVILGDKQGQHLRIGGLLLAIKKDQKYPDRNNYEIVQKDASVAVLAGSAGLDLRITEHDVDHIIKAEYKGKVPGSNAKAIDVQVFEPDLNDPADVAFEKKMIAEWPGYAEAVDRRRSGKAGHAAGAPAASDDPLAPVAATGADAGPVSEELPF